MVVCVPLRARRRGMICSSSMRRNSRGTPGVKKKRPLPISMAKPQAVPTGLSIISAVAGSMACLRLILIEAPSSAYHSGMLVVGKVTKKRRRPHAILYPTAPILLWYRLARTHHVPLYLKPRWRDSGAPEYAGRTRAISQDHRALSCRSRGLCRMHLYLVLARRLVRPRRHSLCARPCALYEGDPRGEGEKR